MHPDFAPMVYLLASHKNGTLYAGVTSDLRARLHQHREGLLEGFTKDYGVQRLVWFEPHSTMEHAIVREKHPIRTGTIWRAIWAMRRCHRGGLVDDRAGDGFPPSRE
jgi:putative endonuclease